MTDTPYTYTSKSRNFLLFSYCDWKSNEYAQNFTWVFKVSSVTESELPLSGVKIYKNVSRNWSLVLLPNKLGTLMLLKYPIFTIILKKNGSLLPVGVSIYCTFTLLLTSLHVNILGRKGRHPSLSYHLVVPKVWLVRRMKIGRPSIPVRLFHYF